MDPHRVWLGSRREAAFPNTCSLFSFSSAFARPWSAIHATTRTARSNTSVYASEDCGNGGGRKGLAMRHILLPTSSEGVGLTLKKSPATRES